MAAVDDNAVDTPPKTARQVRVSTLHLSKQLQAVGRNTDLHPTRPINSGDLNGSTKEATRKLVKVPLYDS